MPLKLRVNDVVHRSYLEPPHHSLLAAVEATKSCASPFSPKNCPQTWADWLWDWQSANLRRLSLIPIHNSWLANTGWNEDWMYTTKLTKINWTVKSYLSVPLCVTQDLNSDPLGAHPAYWADHTGPASTSLTSASGKAPTLAYNWYANHSAFLLQSITVHEYRRAECYFITIVEFFRKTYTLLQPHQHLIFC